MGEYNPKIFADNLLRFMEEYHMNKTELAKAMGVSSGMIKFYLNGTNSPRMDKVDQLCRKYNLPRSYFLESPSAIFNEAWDNFDVDAERQKELEAILETARNDPDYRALFYGMLDRDIDDVSEALKFIDKLKGNGRE